MDVIKDVVKGLDVVGKNVDKLSESGEERQRFITERQRIDMSSDSWLSKNIRPISLLLGWVCFLALITAHIFEVKIDPWIVGEVMTLLGTASGFYFDSKRREKIADKNAVANIKLQELRLKSEFKEERRQRRHEIRLEKNKK